MAGILNHLFGDGKQQDSTKKTYRFHADYFVHTPIKALEMDGQTMSVNSTDDLPHINGGSWLSPGIMTMGRRWDPDSTPTEKKAEEYKRFLFVFRGICEGEGTVAEKIAKLKALGNAPETKEWYDAAKKGYRPSSMTFPDLALWYDLAHELGCDVFKAASLVGSGYDTLERIAGADLAAIEKLSGLGPKSAPKVINAARKKLGLPPLED
jgi:hypothetical protein